MWSSADNGLVAAAVGGAARQRRRRRRRDDGRSSVVGLAGWMAGAVVVVMVASVAGVGVAATETSEMSIEAAFQGRHVCKKNITISPDLKPIIKNIFVNIYT